MKPGFVGENPPSRGVWKGGRRPGQAGGPPTYFRQPFSLSEAGPWGKGPCLGVNEGGDAPSCRLSDWGARLAPKLDRHFRRLVLALDLKGRQVEVAHEGQRPGAALAVEVVLPRGSPRATVQVDGLEVEARPTRRIGSG